MRDPLAPIPSPFGQSTSAEQFWERRPAPETSAAPPSLPPPPSFLPDPRGCLPTAEDELGIDRRSRRRNGTGPLPGGVTRPVTAANHIELDFFVGLRSRHGWALMQTLALSPAGLLLRHFDVLDPGLKSTERHNARQALRRLSAIMTGPTGGSPMSLVCGCVLSKRVVQDLSHWSNPGDEDTTEVRREPMGVSIVIPTPTVQRSGEACRPISGGAVSIPGELTPLTDPAPDVVGVSLTPAGHSRMVLALGV